MDIREIPRRLFEEFATQQVGPATSNALSGQGVALVGQTDSSLWLRYEDAGTNRSYSTDTSIKLFDGSREAAEYHTDGRGNFGSISAHIKPVFGPPRCYDHPDCWWLVPTLSIGLYHIVNDLVLLQPLITQFAALSERAEELLGELPIEITQICKTASYELEAALRRI